MAIVPHFYNGLMKKYVSIFGNLFNEISITREDNSGTQIQKMFVPISYAPRQKFLSILKQDPDKKKKSSITLPTMSFELTAVNYDSQRNLSKHKFTVSGGDANQATVIYSPAPYNLDFTLSIATKYEEDGFKIIEQIMPYFRPKLTNTVNLMSGIEDLDIPLIMTGMSMEDNYEGDYEERRMVIWSLTFTMKALFFGPVRDKNYIKYIDTRLFDTMDASRDENDFNTKVVVRPGLDANGNPTTNVNNSIDWTLINPDDDYAEIVEITHE